MTDIYLHLFGNSPSVWERELKTIHRRHLAQISILSTSSGGVSSSVRNPTLKMDGGEHPWEDWFFSYSLSHEDKQMNPSDYGGALHSFTDSLIHQIKGMPGTRQAQVQVLVLSSGVTFSLWSSAFAVPTWNKTIHQNGLLWGLDKMMYVKYVIQPLTYKKTFNTWPLLAWLLLLLLSCPVPVPNLLPRFRNTQIRPQELAVSLEK